MMEYSNLVMDLKKHAVPLSQLQTTPTRAGALATTVSTSPLNMIVNTVYNPLQENFHKT